MSRVLFTMAPQIAMFVIAGAAVAPIAKADWNPTISCIWCPTSPWLVGHGMAYDQDHQQLVVFGGEPGTGGYPVSDTWTSSPWTKRSPATVPPSRAYFGITYDEARHQVVMFGGSQDDANAPFLWDTWVWDGANWTQKFPLHHPEARSGHSIVYDAALQKVILFGGETKQLPGIYVYQNDTWTWDGNDWTLLPSANSPSPRAFFGFAYDSTRQQVLMYGGQAPNGTTYQQTWVWNGSWSARLVHPPAPSARYALVMADNPAFQEVVLFGGFSSPYSPLGDTWIWDGANWFQKTQNHVGPSGKGSAAMVYDNLHNELVLVGGYTNGSKNAGDPWLWWGK